MMAANVATALDVGGESNGIRPVTWNEWLNRCRNTSAGHDAGADGARADARVPHAVIVAVNFARRCRRSARSCAPNAIRERDGNSLPVYTGIVHAPGGRQLLTTSWHSFAWRQRRVGKLRVVEARR